MATTTSDSTDGTGSISNDGPFQVEVRGAGIAFVNGTYSQNGYINDACAYIMEGCYCIFQRNDETDDSTRWYISDISGTRNPRAPPGFGKFDFYSCPVNDDCLHIPPPEGWVVFGTEPCPVLELVHRNPAQQLQEQAALSTLLEERVVVEDINELSITVQNRKQSLRGTIDRMAHLLLEERAVEDINNLSITVRNRKQSLRGTIDRMAHLTSERRAKLQEDLDWIGNEESNRSATKCSICQDRTKCIICHDRDAVRAVVPCGHLCFCDDGCADALVQADSSSEDDSSAISSSCPLCRGNLDDTMKIHGL